MLIFYIRKSRHKKLKNEPTVKCSSVVEPGSLASENIVTIPAVQFVFANAAVKMHISRGNKKDAEAEMGED